MNLKLLVLYTSYFSNDLYASLNLTLITNGGATAVAEVYDLVRYGYNPEALMDRSPRTVGWSKACETETVRRT